MIDPKLARETPTVVRDALDARRYPLHFLDSFIQADSDWRSLLQEVDSLKQERNTLTPKGKPDADTLSKLKTLADTIRLKQERLQQLEFSVEQAALLLPNIPATDVPIGKSEDDNQVLRQEGTIPIFPFSPKTHDVLGIDLNLMDFENAAKITGSRFVVYKGAGAKLERALIHFMLDVHTSENGYTEYAPPVIVNSRSLQSTGQLPKFEDDLFKLSDTDYFLSPTAEVQLTNLYRDSIVAESQLPLCMTAYEPCFRREAGSYGRDVSGLIRNHQFDKIELVRIVHPDHSEAEHLKLLSHAESILKKLELPYQVVSLCTGDIGFSSAKTIDLEVWFPSQNKYREISSVSNFVDFQARRAMIRYRDTQTGKVHLAHTLNGSGLAVGRTLASILENYQNEDGSIRIPTALQPYMGCTTIQVINHG
jgi:seryl-tRNA synthetase